MKFLSLTNSTKKAIIDDWDYERIIALNTKWHITFNKYKRPKSIQSTRGLNNGSPISLHRFIMNLGDDDGRDVNHINGCIFDNRNKNLEIISHAENIQKGKVHRDNKSGHKGIGFYKRYNKWMVRDKKDFIGYYDTLEEAIKAKEQKL